MKESSGRLAASLLVLGLVAATDPAYAGCLSGNRDPAIPGPDLCVGIAGTSALQEADGDNDNFGDACDGDDNQNCVVDVEDSACVLANYGSIGSFPCDYNGDTVIGLADYQYWRINNFTTVLPDGGN